MNRKIDLYSGKNSVHFTGEFTHMLGLVDGIILSNIIFFVDYNRTQQANMKEKKSFRDGKWWMYQSVRNWRKMTGRAVSERTIKRSLMRLREMGIVEAGCYNDMPGDNTVWYTINEEKLGVIIEVYEQEAAKFEAAKDPDGFDGLDSDYFAPLFEAVLGGSDKMSLPEEQCQNVTAAVTECHSPFPVGSDKMALAIQIEKEIEQKEVNSAKNFALPSSAPKRGLPPRPKVQVEARSAEEIEQGRSDKKQEERSALLRQIESRTNRTFNKPNRELLLKPIYRLNANNEQEELPNSTERYDSDPIFRAYVERQLDHFIKFGNKEFGGFNNTVQGKFANSLNNLEHERYGFFVFRSSYIAKNPSAAPAKIEYLPE